MPKFNPMIVHTISKIVLGNLATNNIYENVNYAKTFIQGTIVNVFDGHIPGGEECHLEVDGRF
jgi:hypothetical protein